MPLGDVRQFRRRAEANRRRASESLGHKSAAVGQTFLIAWAGKAAMRVGDPLPSRQIKASKGLTLAA